LAVDPTYHRQGIASALVDRAEAFALFKKARGIYVDTPVSNAKGRSFYEAVGYQCAYIMPRYYEDGLDGVTYQKFFGQSASESGQQASSQLLPLGGTYSFCALRIPMRKVGELGERKDR
jgi:ribosomal protein S18 acetylase RimI-like enzyme